MHTKIRMENPKNKFYAKTSRQFLSYSDDPQHYFFERFLSDRKLTIKLTKGKTK